MNDKIQNLEDDQSRESLDNFMDFWFLLKFGSLSIIFRAKNCLETKFAEVKEDKAKIFKF